MKKPSFPPALYIDDDDALRDLLARLRHEPLLAIDTESNSLHAYRERVCLVQVSTRSADYIIDPLAVDAMPAFGPLLADPAIEKLFHAAEYDLMTLKRDYGFTFSNLFDTMIAARICGHNQIGLSNLLERYVGITLDKRHQRDDWGARPLPPDSLRYAQMDTHYLPTLRDALKAELEAGGHTEEAAETFRDLERAPAAVHGFDPEGFWRIGKSNKLNRRQMTILRELYLLRETLAEARDVPPFKVFSNELMARLSLNPPATRADLEALKGVPPSISRRYGDQLLEAVARGQKAPQPRPPDQPMTPPDVMERYAALREWRKERAGQRGVESDVILSKEALWNLAEKAPRRIEEMQGIPGLGPWRLARYAEDLLDILKRY